MTSELDLEHKQQCPSFLLWGTSSTDSIEWICIGVVIEFVRAWYWTHVPVYVASYCCNNLVPNHAWILESICRIIMWVLYLDYGLLLWVIYLCCKCRIQSLWFDLLFSSVWRVFPGIPYWEWSICNVHLFELTRFMQFLYRKFSNLLHGTYISIPNLHICSEW
jgi:hypothetical protein